LKILEVIHKVKDVPRKTTASEIVVGTGNCWGCKGRFARPFSLQFFWLLAHSIFF